MGIWPVLDALNKLRNELAHRIDSPKLEDKIVNFLRASEENMMKENHHGILMKYYATLSF
ncbi:hypothetical protein [Citrobacter portucalensis]|uniref:hypothetical protein n=1 Tax=Citrobacter portucalensis TaxID=1639133 RepID=UPI0016467F34|nr:hypothetical protein [Citrobacter portucalensis]